MGCIAKLLPPTTTGGLARTLVGWGGGGECMGVQACVDILADQLGAERF